MRIGGVTSMNGMSGMETLKTVSSDPKIKKIENEITNAKQQMQKISPMEELSDAEKEIERKNLQKEISGLNTRLKQYQEDLRKSQDKEVRMKQLREDQKPNKDEKSKDDIQTKGISSDNADKKNLTSQGTVMSNNNDGTVILKGKINSDEKRGVDAEKKQADETKEKVAADKEKKAKDNAAAETGLSDKKIYAIISADSSIQQADRQGTIIANTRDGIAVLKTEMNQDERRGADTEKKQAELEKMEKREQRATAFQSSILGEANNAMKSAAKTSAAEKNEKAQVNSKNNAAINALGVPKEESQASQQRFQVVFG